MRKKIIDQLLLVLETQYSSQKIANTIKMLPL